MAYYWLTGEELNAIVPAATAPVMTPTADFLYGASQLYDGKPYLAGKFGSVLVDSTVTVDLNVVPWPGFESGVAPAVTSYATAWAVADGLTSITRDTGIKNSGAASLKLTGVGSAFFDVLVRPGQLRNLEWAIYGAGSGSILFRVFNMHTGRYLHSDGTWGAAADLDTQTTAAWKTGSRQYQVESLETCGWAPLVWVRAFFFSSVSPAYVDDVYDYPAIDFAGAFGTQNWDPVLAPQLRSSTDNFSSSDVLQSALTFAKPVVSARLVAPVYHRYWRLKLLGTPRVAPGLGELVLGRAEALLRPPNLGPRVAWREAGQIRRGAISGATRARNMGPWPTREAQMSWRFESQAQFRQFRDEIFRGSRGGAIPMIMFATDAETTKGLDYALFGMLSETFAGRRLESEDEYWDVDLELDEQPFPSL